MTHWIESGSPASPVWLVGEAPGRQEIEQGSPLVGASGQELNKMLAEAGWPTTGFFRSNICHERPPSYQLRGRWIHNDIERFFAGKLQAKREGIPEVNGRYPQLPIQTGLARLSRLALQHHPRLILALGGSALWGLCGRDGITKWRGSVLDAGEEYGGGKVVPTLHPAIIADQSKGQYTYRPIIVQDLRRAKRELEQPTPPPAWDFCVAPTLSDVKDWLLPWIWDKTPLVADTEGLGVVDCIGFADSSKRAICIPFTKGDGTSYWSKEDEIFVFGLVRNALCTCPITFHNAIWDMQVIGKNWGYLPNLQDDTMVAQHCAFPGLLGGKIDPVTGQTDKRGSSLSLSFCASMYCEQYVYWKDDGRLRGVEHDDQSFWRYNCEDCARTYEVRTALIDSVLPSAKLVEQYRFLMSLFRPVLKIMFRGVRVDRGRATALKEEITQARAAQQAWLDASLGYHLNVHSTAQNGEVQALFYSDLNCDVVKSRKTGALSTDNEALDTIARRNPVLLPLVRVVQNIRSLDTNEATFLRPVLGGWKGKEWIEPCGERLRTCLNIAGAETFRFTSNETAFGEGLNLQNWTRPE